MTIIEDKIHKAHTHINTYLFAYQECERRNKNLLTFTEELLKSYSQNTPNYFLEKNLINNSNIHIYEYNTVIVEKINKENIDEVVKYFNSYSIIQERKLKVEKLS